MGSQPPVAEPLEWTGATRRKRDAKRFNEHVKLFATFLNNFAIALVVTGVLAPAMNGDEWSRPFHLASCVTSFVSGDRATRQCASDPSVMEE